MQTKPPTRYIVIPHLDSNTSRRRGLLSKFNPLTGKREPRTHLTAQFVRSESDDAIEAPYRPTARVIRSMTRSKYLPHVGRKQAAKLNPVTTN